MKQLLKTCLLAIVATTAVAQPQRMVRTDVPTDSIILSDPCVLADEATGMYYMTGTGGMLWKSKDLKKWDGPTRVAMHDTASWMGQHPQIWAAELHQYKGKYYYFATFTNNAIKIDSVRGNIIPRRACHVLRSDKPEGPYTPFGDEMYLRPNQPTLDGTLWVESDGTPYLVFCGEWLQNWNGTVEAIKMKEDLSGTIGRALTLFRASDSPWSVENNVESQGDMLHRADGSVPNKVTDGPWLFRTGTGRLGIIWTSWCGHDYTQGVAYSKSGTIFGPWEQEAEPITPPNFGHGMIFRDLNGRWLLSCHSHKDVHGRYIRRPHFFEIDLSGDKLVLHKDDYLPEPALADSSIHDGYKLTWSDEFLIDGRPAEHWSYEHGFVRNNELQWYQPENAHVEGGCLIIDGKREVVPNPRFEEGSKDWRRNRKQAEYTSSILISAGKFEFKYGRLEVRARIPVSGGAWPAIWTLGNQWGWPENGEVDMLEHYLVDGRQTILANAAWGGEKPFSAVWNDTRTPLTHFTDRDPNWVSKFHVWRMDWDKDFIRLYLDDELLNEINLKETNNRGNGGNTKNPFSNDVEGFGQYVLLNLAIGSNGGTPDDSAFPLKMEVDYVRYFKKL